MKWMPQFLLALAVLTGTALSSRAATIFWSSRALVNEGTYKSYMGTGQVDSTGIKVVAANGWFAARPSGTENIYKIYAESFTSAEHLAAIVAEAQTIVSATV